jgi:oligoendopeptidase F
MTEESKIEKTGAENILWNLDDLYPSISQMETSLKQASIEAEEIEKEYRNRVADLTPIQLFQAIERFEILGNQLNRAFTYVFLNWCTDTSDPGRGAKMQKVREQHMLISQKLLFFEIELIRMDDTKTDALNKEPLLEKYHHYLEMLWLRRDHILSEPEEKIISEKSVTGSEAWSRYFDQLLGAAKFTHNGKKISEQEILSLLYDPDRSVRKSAAESFTKGLKEHLPSLAYIFNTSLAEKASEDRIRQYPNWLSARNLSNEISQQSVEALVNAVTGRYGLVARYYGLKKRLLGLDELFDWDRYAPVQLETGKCSWEKARKTVLDAYYSFHPGMGEIASMFFDQNWIDAALRPGKRSGAFSHSAVPDVHPYVLMNYTGTSRDVQTLAHELGHGVHQYLARKQGALNSRTPLTTSETASVFGEMLVFEKLVRAESSDARKLALIVSKLDDSMATVFRQISMNQFEERIHGHRREKGELSIEEFNQHWLETQNEMFQGSVTLSENYGIWWSYIPHFIHTPGYVYAYAFGELLVLALYSMYLQNPEAFPEQYLELLSAGGSDWPHKLVGELGVDLNNPEFWNNGLEEIEKMIERAESLAD